MNSSSKFVSNRRSLHNSFKIKSVAKTYLLYKKISDVKSNAHVRYLRIETEESLLNELMH